MGLSGWDEQQRLCIARALAVPAGGAFVWMSQHQRLTLLSTSKIEELMEDLKKK